MPTMYTSVKADTGATSTTLYKPWGEVRYQSGPLPTDYTYTGQYSHTDDFGLMFYVARWYDPLLGRFAQADTLVPGAGNPMAFDRYAYTSNNPVIYTDPSGHCNMYMVENGMCTAAELTNTTDSSLRVDTNTVIPDGGAGQPSGGTYGHAAEQGYTGFYNGGESKNSTTNAVFSIPSGINDGLVWLRDNTNIEMLIPFGSRPSVYGSVNYNITETGFEITDVSLTALPNEPEILGIGYVLIDEYSLTSGGIVGSSDFLPSPMITPSSCDNSSFAYPGSISGTLPIGIQISSHHSASVTIYFYSQSGRYGKVGVNISVNPTSQLPE